MNNNLKNKTIIFAIILVVIASVVFIPQLIHDSKNKEGKSETAQEEEMPCDSTKTPYYCEVRSEIIKLGKAKWDKAAYQQVKNYIGNYTTVSHKISQKEETKLNEMLDAKYLGVLAKAINNHCSTSVSLDINLLNDFDNELKKILPKPATLSIKSSLTSLLLNFKVAVKLPATIDGYLYNLPYNEGTNQRFISQIAGFEKTDVINKNQGIISSIRQRRITLGQMQTLQRTLERCTQDRTLLNDVGDAGIQTMASINGRSNSYYYRQLRNLMNNE